jgi:hypothetical protein
VRLPLSVCQMTRDFDTQRTGVVALSCDLRFQF